MKIFFSRIGNIILSIIRVRLSCKSNGGSFWSYCRSLFWKSWTAKLSIHLFSLYTRINAMGVKNVLYMILRVRCWSNLALNRVRQKVSSAKKSAQWKSPFGQKSVWLKSQFSHKSVQPATPLPQPHRITCLWSPILALNIIQNCFIRLYCDSYYISVWWNSSQVVIVCVSLFTVNRGEQKHHFWPLRLVMSRKVHAWE